MATKDWELSNHWKDGVSFRNIHKKDFFVQSFKDKTHSPPFRFTVHADGKIRVDVLFKTREELNNFAGLYMRKH